MENIYAIFEKEEKLCPVLLEGILHTEFFDKKPFESRESDVGEWRTIRDIETELPEELWFVSKDIRYAFDFREHSQGYFLSLEFVNLLLEFGINNFQYTKLNMVNSKKESITTKEYYYARFFNRLEDVIDLEKSNIEFYKQDGRMKKIWDLQLKKLDISPDVFLIDNIKLLSVLFCSEKFKTAAEKLKLKGITFVPSNEAGVYKTY